MLHVLRVHREGEKTKSESSEGHDGAADSPYGEDMSALWQTVYGNEDPEVLFKTLLKPSSLLEESRNVPQAYLGESCPQAKGKQRGVGDGAHALGHSG